MKLCIVLPFAFVVTFMTQMSSIETAFASAKIPKSYLKCAKDTDCAETSSTGCGCTAGGDRLAISKANLEKWETKFAAAACTEDISTHTSCSKKIKCEENVCVLQLQ